jgi:hypothetical protein
MKSRALVFFIICTIVYFALPSLSAGQTRPVQIALVNPIQIFPENTPIEGIRWNLLYGRNIAMTGLDFGLVNHVGSGGFTGVQLGLVGINDGDVKGIQWNGVNIAKMNVEGAQLGWFSSAHYVHGVQISLVNYTGSMKGIQIGIINIIDEGGMFPVFPIVNWSL